MLVVGQLIIIIMGTVINCDIDEKLALLNSVENL